MNSRSCRGLLSTLGVAALLAVPARAERIEVATKAVPLNPRDPAQSKVGRLVFRGGLALTSIDPRFGGFSSLRLTEDGTRITCVSDQGTWFTAHILYDAGGLLAGLAEAEMGPLLDTDGRPLTVKEASDAESLARMPDGSMVVGFEHQHRFWRYPTASGRLDGRPTPVPGPAGLEQAPVNGGVEALVSLSKGHLFALTEYGIVDEQIRGWVQGREGWQPLGYKFDGAFRPSDMATLPSGDVVVLERAYNPDRGIVGVRLRRVGKRSIRGGARITSEPIAALDPPLTLDNFEGIDTIRGRKGETVVYLISDDNFQAEQRTLLLMFALPKR